MTMKSPYGAIAGLGMTPMTRSWQGDATVLAARAIKAALADAGLEKTALDGLLIASGLSGRDPSTGSPLGLGLQTMMGLRNLKLMNHMSAAGSTPGQAIQYASMAIQAGICTTVACVWADSPLNTGQSAGGAYGGGGGSRPNPGMAGLGSHYGFFGANTSYALAAQRHMALYGTTHDQFGAIAVSNRQWAELNPLAQQRSPLTIEDYHNSRWVVEPFHLLDCCLVTNGGVAVIVTAPERAADLKQPAVYVIGMGQGHPGNPARGGYENEINTGAAIARDAAFGMAGITNDDIDICELYDCYTYTTLVTLEDYGFCKKGEGGDFVAGGRLAPGGELPTNTGGGMLSGYYMWGMTPISEAIIQARGQGGARQVPKHDVVLVSAQGGILDYHSTLVLSPHRSAN